MQNQRVEIKKYVKNFILSLCYGFSSEKIIVNSFMLSTFSAWRKVIWWKFLYNHLLLLLSTPPLMPLESSHNWPTVYADNLSLHVSSRGITLTGSVHRSRTVMGVYSSVHVKRCVVSCFCVTKWTEWCCMVCSVDFI